MPAHSFHHASHTWLPAYMAYLFGWPTKQMTTQIILTPLPKMFNTHTHTHTEWRTLKWQPDSRRGVAVGVCEGVADMATYCAMFYATKTKTHTHARERERETRTRSWKLLGTLLLLLCITVCSPRPPTLCAVCPSDCPFVAPEYASP